jgi:hypothetical protein
MMVWSVTVNNFGGDQDNLHFAGLEREFRGQEFRGQTGVDPPVETASKRDSCGWLLRTLQQQG